MASFTNSHCGRWYRHGKDLKIHVMSGHVNLPLFSCDQTHLGNCTGRGVGVAPAAKKLCTGAAPERLQFKLQNSREALEGNIQQFTVNMKEAKCLSTLRKAIDVFKLVMMNFQQKHSAYKFQIAVGVVFHKAVDPTVVTRPPVPLTPEMVAVYADAPPLNDVDRQPLNSIDVYEQNGSGWIFQTFFSLQL